MGHSYTVERAYARGDAPQEARGDYAELGEFLPGRRGWRQGGAYAKGRGMSRKAIPADDPYSAGGKFAFVQLVKKTGRHVCVRLSGNSHRGYPLQNPYGAHQQWHPVHLPPTLRGRSNGEIHDACVRHVLPAIELGILPIEDESGYYPKHRNGGHARCIQPRRQTPTQVHHLRQRHRVRPAWATQNRARYGDLANRKRPRITPFLVSIWLL